MSVGMRVSMIFSNEVLARMVKQTRMMKIMIRMSFAAGAMINILTRTSFTMGRKGSLMTLSFKAGGVLFC